MVGPVQMATEVLLCRGWSSRKSQQKVDPACRSASHVKATTTACDHAPCPYPPRWPARLGNETGVYVGSGAPPTRPAGIDGPLGLLERSQIRHVWGFSSRVMMLQPQLPQACCNSKFMELKVFNYLFG